MKIKNLVILGIMLLVLTSCGAKGDVYKLGTTGYEVMLEGKFKDGDSSPELATLKSEDGNESVIFAIEDAGDVKNTEELRKNTEKSFEEFKNLASSAGEVKVTKGKMLGEDAVNTSAELSFGEQSSVLKSSSIIDGDKKITVSVIGVNKDTVDKDFDEAVKTLKKSK